jgi:phosphatidylglycerol:prolipoprotein diacylglycerol transferase
MGPFVHNIDPVIGKFGGLYLWWYGLAYTLGFLGVFLWLRRSRRRLEMTLAEVYGLTILLASGVLLGGRLVEVVFYEWPHYAAHPWRIPAVWLGGMSTHGILLGGAVGTLLYCRIYRKKFLAVADILAVAAAFIMGMGRLGNFIDGQIVGSVTDIPWAVKFPDAEGFRHPVVLYDGAKNLLLVPVLLLLRRSRPPPGVVLAHFILWYGGLRIFVDLYRVYPTTFLGFPPGQEFNAIMAAGGLGLLIWFHLRRREPERKVDSIEASRAAATDTDRGLWPQRAVLAGLLLLPLVIPSDWTQDVPARYGKRHRGMSNSGLYPRIPDGPDATQSPADQAASCRTGPLTCP